MPARSAFSLRTELLASFALLAIAALIIAVASVLVLAPLLAESHGVFYLSGLIVLDVCVLVVFAAYQVEREVMRPLREAAAAAEAIAAGDLHRRVPAGRSVEINNLADSFNRMTDHLLDERAQLVRAEKLASVGRLAAGVAHEVGNPLGAMTGYLHVLTARLRDRPDLAEVTSGLERESSRIDRIVRGLLDYSRARKSAAGNLGLNEIVRATVELLSIQGVFRHVALNLELSPKAPTVTGDRHELEQVFVNLLLNAVDAMSGSGSITITTERVARDTLRQPSARRSDADASGFEHPPDTRVGLWLADHDDVEVGVVVIADSGPGIPVELREKIFDPFFTTKEPGHGTGLGLAIVSRIVDNAGGTIWVTQAREGGAAFHMLFPLAALVRVAESPRERSAVVSR